MADLVDSLKHGQPISEEPESLELVSSQDLDEEDELSIQEEESLDSDDERSVDIRFTKCIHR